MREIFFHEDDYCQIELLPLAAQAHCTMQMGRIGRFAAEHAADGGFGFTGIYVRADAPYPVGELHLSVEALAAAIEPHFAAYDAVYTGYSSYRERCQQIRAWGDDSFVLFVVARHGRIQHLWLNSWLVSSLDAAKVTTALRAIPQSSGLLLADWSGGVIVPLADASALEAYFRADDDGLG